MLLGSWKLLTLECIPSLSATPMPDTARIEKPTHFEPVSLGLSISRHTPITIWRSYSDEAMVTADASPEE